MPSAQVVNGIFTPDSGRMIGEAIPRARDVDRAREIPAPALGAGRPGRRLRRHRHQPALRHPRVLLRAARRRTSTRANVLGVLSLVFWTLIVVVTLKYHVYVMRADNRGEGGILALMALVRGRVRGQRPRRWLVGLGLFGAALLYGDGMLTPAISVLGAVEGLDGRRAAPSSRFVVPMTVAILIAPVHLPARGTAGVGAVFGPVMLVWFVHARGARRRAASLREPGGARRRQPAPRGALPRRERRSPPSSSSARSSWSPPAARRSMPTSATSASSPIQIDWFCLVAPVAAAQLLRPGRAAAHRSGSGAATRSICWRPTGRCCPLVVLATMAAIIASQAIISGSFSLTRQAVQLGYLPRVEIVHTSPSEIGQIYVPRGQLAARRWRPSAW